MDSSGNSSRRTSTASPMGAREESSPPTTEVPPLVRADVGTANNDIHSNTGAIPRSVGRRVTGAALPAMPVPVPAVPCHSPLKSEAVTAPSIPGTLPVSVLNPVSALMSATTPHVDSAASFSPTSQSAEASGAEDSTAAVEPEPEPLLTNGSIALAEFTSLLKPAENTNVLREHIIHLLHGVDTEDTLVRIARTLEAQQGGAHSSDEVSSTTWNESSRMTRTTTNASQSTGASMLYSAKQSRRSSAMSRQDATSFEALAGFSFLHSHRLTGSMQDSPSSHQPSEDTMVHNQSMRGVGGPMEVSFSSQSSRPTCSPHSRRTSKHKLRDDASSLTATRTSQLSETAAVPRVDPLKREIPILPSVLLNKGRRVAVSAAPCGAPPGLLDDSAQDAGTAELVQQPPPPPLRVIQKTPAEEQQLRRLLRRCHSFASLEANVLEDVVRAMEREVHAAGTAILEQGQDSSEKMYLVGEGTCEAIKNGKSMGPLQPGGTFGELELMYKQAKCAATIRCVTRCVLYSLDETSYHRAVMTNSLQKRRRFENLTLNVPFLRCMPDFERMKIAEALVTREYRRGQAIIKFGVPGVYMHFIVEGEVKVVGRNNGRRVEVVRLHAGDVVGELEFLFNHLTVADVLATSHRVVTACISREHFELIIGPIQDRLKEFVATSSTYEKYYLSEVAEESVRSELRRIKSTRKHRRVASRESAMALEDVNAHGEVLLSAPLELLHGNGKAGPAKGGGTGTLSATTEALNDACGDSARLPKALLRFPFSPVTGKGVAVLVMREDGLIVYWNAVLEKLTGYLADEAIGQNIYSFLLAEREQHSMLKAITTARSFAGNVDAFMAQPNTKVSPFTLARRDGLTNATVQLTVVPPVVSAGGNAAEVVLGFGEEVKQGPQKMLEQPQWLSAQIHSILADGSQTFEERLEHIAETLNNFEATYRAMTVSTERLRVVNIRQMVGHVLMDFGSAFVTRGVSVRQRFEVLPSERAYLDADLLPECLRYAMKLCLKFSQVGGGIVTIMITVTEKNGLEFLIINFNLAGDGLPEDIAKFFNTPCHPHATSAEDDTSGDEEEDEEEGNFSSANTTPKRARPPWLCHKLRRVQRAVEQQGGTLRIQRNPDDANIVFLIPFMPASDHDVENASVEESLRTLMESSMQSVSLNVPGATAGTATAVARAAKLSGTSLLPVDHSKDVGSVFPAPTPADESGLLNGSAAALNQPNFSFTTCLAEDTSAHRIMLSSFLWERRHAVLTAFKFEDVVKLFGVADILIIDLQQSVITSLHDDDPINRLREMLRHMAIIVTSTSFELVSSETYEAAGFITLKKPCTPVQAMKAIHRAEEASAVVKLERIRIEQTRETLARNSRGAWRRGALLGKGSTGEVYEAYDVLTGGKMAVKEMRLGGNDAKIEQFVQEISTMCNLQHPNIIHYFYCEESKEQRVIRVFMEFAGGGTLQSLLKKKGKLEFAELRALLRDVVEGLAYIHSQHYVHCDIKTANVLLSAEGKGKIGDFGTAHTVHDGELLYVMQGSPLYMSPECMSAGEEGEDGNRIGYSFPSDIWSLGCVAMEMATTKPPFSHIKNMKGPAGLTSYITSLSDVPDLSPLFKCEPSVVEFVSACLKPDPEQRATAQDLLQLSIFSESSNSDCNSAVRALKGAQLRHILSKFVAFQEPEEAVELERRRNQFRVRQRSSDFFSSSASNGDSGRVSLSSSRSSSFSTATTSNLTGLSKQEKAAAHGHRRSGVVVSDEGNYGVDNGGGTGDTMRPDTTVRPSPEGSSNFEEPLQCSETAVQHGNDGEDGSAKNREEKYSDGRGERTRSADNAHNSKQRHRNSSSDKEDAPVNRQTSPKLRKWHSSSTSSASSLSSSPLSDRAAGQEKGDGHLPTMQLLTLKPPWPIAQTTVASPEDLQAPLCPLHHGCHHHDPHTGVVVDKDGSEPEPLMPTNDAAYDLSPTPKRRSKTQSRPDALQQQQQQRRHKKSGDRHSLRKQQHQRRRSISTSNSTDSNEAAFFATSSESSKHSSDSDNDHEVTSLTKHLEMADTFQENEKAAAATAGVTAIVVSSKGGAEAIKAVTAMTTVAEAAVLTFESSNPLYVHPELDASPSSSAMPASSNAPGSTLSAPPSSGAAAAAKASTTTDRSSPSKKTISAVSHMPTFTGRRRNVTMDEEGNIVTFQRFTSSGSASVSRDSRGTGTASNRGLGTPKSGAAVATHPPDQTSPMVDAGERLSCPFTANLRYPPPPDNHGVLPSSSSTPPFTNVSIAQPPNMSFYNYSFNKNISFMGANIDEVLSNAANDFLSSLVSANNNNSAHSPLPGASSLFSVNTQTAPSTATTERRGSKHSAGTRDTDAHGDSLQPFNSPLVPDAPRTADGEPNWQSSAPSRSPSATQPTQHCSADHAGNSEKEEREEGSGLHAGSRHGSPLPQAPHLATAGSRSLCSNTSSADADTASTSPRGNSVPLVGVNASTARRPPLARPPITNQSFFVVEDHGIPMLTNNSMVFPGMPFFARGGTGVNSSVTGSNATVSLVPVGATTLSNAVRGGVGCGGSSVGGESTHSVFRHNPNVAVVAPQPFFSAFATIAAKRDAWKHRRRFGPSNNNTSAVLGSSRTALSNSNADSQHAPSHGGDTERHYHNSSAKGDGDTAAMSCAVPFLPAEDSIYDDGALSSAAFNSVRSVSLPQSSVQEDIPYLTAERLQQVMEPASRNRAGGSLPLRRDRVNSGHHSTVFFDSLASQEELPLLVHLKRINQSLLDLEAQLRAHRRLNSDPTPTSTLFGSAVSVGRSTSPFLVALSPSPHLQSPIQRPRAAAALPNPVHSVQLSSLASVTPNVEGGAGGGMLPRTASGLGRPSLPRPVSSCAGSLTASTPREPRSDTLPQQQQVGRNNPLWPLDEDRNSNDKGSTSSLFQPSHPQSSTAESIATNSATNIMRPPPHSSFGSDVEGAMSKGSANGAGVEELLQKTLQRVNVLIEQLAHAMLPVVPPLPHPTVTAALPTTAAASSSADDVASAS